MTSVLGRATAEQLDKRLGLGMKHVACETRITGYYMKRHCRKVFHSSMRCDLEDSEKRRVQKIAKLCCEDATSCEPTELFEEFCCLDDNCGNDCKVWDEASEEIELSNLIHSSDEYFEEIQDKLIAKMKIGISGELLPTDLKIYSKENHMELIDENEELIRKHFKAHRLQTAHLAKILNLM
ncbi:unnamed protein product [Caenorhabditis angaria]|uniref:Uncharacterized protein n=1 Tax=Caenorhabditis angaria TaxID=860376 RepID=A0A9P1IVT9_9PELO|nr:unnamed protein product [Caenorhabditis angaria]